MGLRKTSLLSIVACFLLFEFGLTINMGTLSISARCGSSLVQLETVAAQLHGDRAARIDCE